MRFAVWAQGCSIQCPGCFNPHLWGTSGGQAIEVSSLAQRAVQSGAQGVTLLGGEPFDQAPDFAAFAREVGRQGLSVMTFTGHSIEYLRSPQRPEGSELLLSATDLLVDGPYLADHIDNARPWAGSTNQRFHFLTDRYAALEVELSSLTDRLEVRVSATGRISINGWADVTTLDELLSGTTRSIGRGQVR